MRDITDQREDLETVGAEAPTEAAATRQGGGHVDSLRGDTEADILRSELDSATKRLGELEAEAAEARDRYVRSRAEFDTFRRRMADELNMAREAGLDSVVIPVLGVYDDLERAVTAASATPDPSTILPGVVAVRDGLIRNLEALGIRRVGTVGEQFDPLMHEALAVVAPSAQVGENVIAQVYESGFVKGDRLIRPAKVVVAKSS